MRTGDFHSKQALLEAVVDRMSEAIAAHLRPVADAPDVAALEKLRRFLATLAGWKSERRDVLVALLRVWISDDNAVLRQKLRPLIAGRMAPLLGSIVAQGVREGVFTAAYPEQCGRVLVSAGFGGPGRPENPARLVRSRTSVERKAPMTLALTILLILFCVQGLVKFAVGFLVPYSTRIRRIASYYERDGRIIGIYDTVTLLIIVAMVVLLVLTDLRHLSFITGLVAGMLIIQIFFHRFHRPLPADKAPESPAPPRNSCLTPSRPTPDSPGARSSS